MKIKEGFVLHKVGTENVVVPTEEATRLLNGTIMLNGTGALLWEQIQTSCASKEQLSDFLCTCYGISSAQAQEDVSEFLEILRSAKCIEE